MKSLISIVLLLLVTGSSIFGQHTIKLTGSSPSASLDQVSWISGHWHGEAFGGVVEEVWTEPLGNSMMGSFKLVVDGQVSFYEICIIREIGETILFQLKHFNGDLTGWEEKGETVDFPLVKVEKDKVYFDQFTIERISNDEMHFYVVISNDGVEEEVLFKYYRDKN
jgi:hypothetical protein